MQDETFEGTLIDGSNWRNGLISVFILFYIVYFHTVYVILNNMFVTILLIAFYQSDI